MPVKKDDSEKWRKYGRWLIMNRRVANLQVCERLVTLWLGETNPRLLLSGPVHIISASLQPGNIYNLCYSLGDASAKNNIDPEVIYSQCPDLRFIEHYIFVKLC